MFLGTEYMSVSMPVFIGNETLREEGGDRADFGRETLIAINRFGSLSLNETTVINKVYLSGTILATRANIEVIQAGGSAIINSTIGLQRVYAGINVTLFASNILGKVYAVASVIAKECAILGGIRAGHSINLEKCPDVGFVFTQGDLTLRETTVQKNVIARGEVVIENSTIRGSLTCESNHLIIEGSTIEKIVLHCSKKIPNGFLLGAPPVIELRNSRVRKILFKGCDGEVILSGESSLIGKITGAKTKV